MKISAYWIIYKQNANIMRSCDALIQKPWLLDYGKDVGYGNTVKHLPSVHHDYLDVVISSEIIWLRHVTKNLNKAGRTHGLLK